MPNCNVASDRFFWIISEISKLTYSEITIKLLLEREDI